MSSRQEKLEAFGRLLDIMDDLREKCPWDKKQTFESLRPLTIEETYELADAILENDSVEIKKELGDLLLHIVFYAKIGSETQSFDVKDVMDSLCDKLIHRHPHIYGDVVADDEEAVKANWEKLKIKEGNQSVLQGVPKSLPSLVKASRIQDKAKAVGFDWENADQVWEKIQEELVELQKEIKDKSSKSEIVSEFGDVLFSLINYARFLDIDPDEALEKTNKKFISRFQFIETKALESNRSIPDLSLEEMNLYWNQAKIK